MKAKDFLIVGGAALAVFVLMRKSTGGAPGRSGLDAPWWSGLELSAEQRSMLESQEPDFWPVTQGNTGYPVEAITGTGAPAKTIWT